MLDAFVERRTRTIRGNLVLIALRLILATLALTVLVIQEVHNARAGAPAGVPLYFRPPALVAIIVCVLTALYYLLIAKRSGQSPQLATKLAFLQIFVDIFLISALLWHTGGVASQFVVLYLISICAAAFVLKWNAGMLAALVSAVLFCAIAILYSRDIVPDHYRAASNTLVKLKNAGDVVRLLLLPVGAFFLTGVLAGVLSRRLAIARLQLDEILEGIGDGVLVVDARLQPLYHNGEFVRMLGLAASPRNGNLENLLGPEVAKAAQEVLQDLRPARVEINHKRPDEKIVPFSVRLGPMMDLDLNTARGLIVAVKDITAERKMEEFAKHRQRIETMGKISATIAHEIRNPLASIRGAVQEIGRSVPIPEGKRILIDIVLAESDRLEQIIADFLRFARMRPPKLTPTDLGRVLADVKLLLAARPESSDIQITLAGDEGDPFNADPEQLRQLFLNLGLNALQAMNGRAKNELALNVSVVPLHRARGFGALALERLDRPGVLVEMRDTGSGMSPEVQEQIFEPFYTTKATGTGLGLAIVQRIVQSHEGAITVESRPDQGTIFRVWLPTDRLPGAGSSSGARSAVP